jgi:ABC-type antimicrobial peptide transport system permease subunit
MDTTLKDIRFAARSLLKRPGFSVIVVLTLALGIGANAAVFSVINAVLLRPLPYRDVDRVVTLWQNNTKAGNSRNEVSPANFLDWKEQSSSSETLAGIEPSGFTLVGDGEPERISAWLVTSGFFQVAGTDALLGRTFTDEDYQPGSNRFLLGLFAAIALLLATIGIYGSISYSTRQRTNEIGVRIALGAQPLDVLRLIVGQGVGQALVGVVIGLAAAFLLTRTIKTFLFGVTPTDPLTFVAISLLLVVTAFIASLIPARRATKVDPLVALRSE